MIESLRALGQVHEHDTRIAAIDTERSSFPEVRERLQVALERAGADVERAAARVDEAEREQRQLEAQLQDAEALTERLEGQTLNVKSNDAYHALLNEIEHSKKTRSDLETGILEMFEQVEAGTASLEAARATAAQAEATAEAEERRLADREAELDKERARLEADRKGCAEGVDAALLSRYERVAKRKLPALATVDKGACGECHVTLPRQQVIEIERGEEVFACAGCLRILVPHAAASS